MWNDVFFKKWPLLKYWCIIIFIYQAIFHFLRLDLESVIIKDGLFLQRLYGLQQWKWKTYFCLCVHLSRQCYGDRTDEYYHCRKRVNLALYQWWDCPAVDRTTDHQKVCFVWIGQLIFWLCHEENDETIKCISIKQYNIFVIRKEIIILTTRGIMRGRWSTAVRIISNHLLHCHSELRQSI